METRREEAPGRLTRRPPIFLADLVRAIVLLNARDGALEEISRMLSLDQLRQAPETTAAVAWRPLPPSAPRQTEARRAPATTDAEPRSDAQPDDPGPPVRGAIREVTEPGSLEMPPWSASTSAMAAPPTIREGVRPDPLIAPQRQRAMLGAALARWTADGPPDIPRLLDDVATLRPLTHLPVERVPSLRLGVQVLVDVSPGMAPYRHDCDAVIAGIADLVSADRLEVLRFAGCPSRRVGTGPVSEWRAWQPPRLGTPTLLLTDLGIGGPLVNPERSSQVEWVAFGDVARRAGCPLVALVPFAHDRWPIPLIRYMTVVHWDRSTTVGAVRRVVRHLETIAT
jgi:hypothetical protein